MLPVKVVGELPALVIQTLQRHREQQQTARKQVGDRWRAQDIVFCNRYGGYIEVSNLHVAFKRVLKRAGLPDILLHDPRHSAASILLSMEVNPKIVQELLGYSHISISFGIYAHVFPSMRKRPCIDWTTCFRRKRKNSLLLALSSSWPGELSCKFSHQSRSGFLTSWLGKATRRCWLGRKML